MDFERGQKVFIEGTIYCDAKSKLSDRDDYMLVQLEAGIDRRFYINKKHLKKIKPTDNITIPVSYKLPKFEAMAVDIASLLIKFRINHDFLPSDIARMLSISMSDLESIENGDGSKISLDLIIAVEQLTGVEFITSPLKEGE